MTNDLPIRNTEAPQDGTNLDEGATLDVASQNTQALTAPILVKELTKEFSGQTVVDRVSFAVPKGTVFGFIGPSGCGKTTTVRMLTGIYQPNSGTVEVLGQAPVKLNSNARRRIGYMPQQFVLYPDLSILENMNFAASIYGVGFGRGKRIKEQLEFVELWEHRHKRVRQISGGMQRRLSLATTLIHDPELIFLDEPTTGLDPVLRQKLWSRFHELKENGITLFVTTQYVSDAAYCDLIGMMVEGRLITVDTPEGLRRQALGGDVVLLRSVKPIEYTQFRALNQLPFVKRVERIDDNEVSLTVDNAASAIPDLVEYSRNNAIETESVKEFIPDYDQIFVNLIRKESHVA